MEPLPTQSGVTSDSALGPLLFLIVINNIGIEKKALLYADDTTLISMTLLEIFKASM